MPRVSSTLAAERCKDCLAGTQHLAEAASYAFCWDAPSCRRFGHKGGIVCLFARTHQLAVALGTQAASYAWLPGRTILQSLWAHKRQRAPLLLKGPPQRPHSLRPQSLRPHSLRPQSLRPHCLPHEPCPQGRRHPSTAKLGRQGWSSAGHSLESLGCLPAM